MDNAPFSTQTDPLSETEEQAPQQSAPQPSLSAPQATPLSEYVPEDEPVAAAPEKDEITRLLEDPTQPLMLTSGTVFRIKQMRLREMLRLLRIISYGATNMVDALDLNFDEPDEFVQTFVAMVIFAIPEAEDQTVDFLQSMVDIGHPTGNPKLDDTARLELAREMANPDLQEAVTIITAIVAHEGRDLAALGKRLRSLFAVANKMGQVPDALKPMADG